jgi:hypothetical protein
MTLIASITKKSGGDRNLVAIEVTENGIVGEMFRILDDYANAEATIWEGKAVLLCEGVTDNTDGISDEHRLKTFNPFEKFLKREHPTVSLHKELRNRVQELEIINRDLERRVHIAEGKVSKIREQL